jgi:hypothetical protein
MKLYCLAALILAGLALGGCESLPGQSGGRPGPAPEKTRTYQAEPRTVYDAALASLAQMEFHVTGGGPAQGKIKAVSRLSSDVNLQTTRQITMSVQITASGDGNCVVEVELKEAIEEDAGSRLGYATETPLRDTPYYEVFFNGIAQALSAPKKD